MEMDGVACDSRFRWMDALGERCLNGVGGVELAASASLVEA